MPYEYDLYMSLKAKFSLASIIMAFFLNNQSYSVEKVSEEKCNPVYTCKLHQMPRQCCLQHKKLKITPFLDSNG